MKELKSWITYFSFLILVILFSNSFALFSVSIPLRPLDMVPSDIVPAIALFYGGDFSPYDSNTSFSFFILIAISAAFAALVFRDSTCSCNVRFFLASSRIFLSLISYDPAAVLPPPPFIASTISLYSLICLSALNSFSMSIEFFSFRMSA